MRRRLSFAICGNFSPPPLPLNRPLFSLSKRSPTDEQKATNRTRFFLLSLPRHQAFERPSAARRVFEKKKGTERPPLSSQPLLFRGPSRPPRSLKQPGRARAPQRTRKAARRNPCRRLDALPGQPPSVGGPDARAGRGKQQRTTERERSSCAPAPLPSNHHRPAAPLPPSSPPTHATSLEPNDLKIPQSTHKQAAQAPTPPSFVQ